MQKRMKWITLSFLYIFVAVLIFMSSPIKGASISGQVKSHLEVLEGAELSVSGGTLCGPACLYIACRYLGLEDFSLSDITEMTGWDSIKGTSMQGLYDACTIMGLYVKCFDMDLSQLTKIMNKNNSMAITEYKGHFYLYTKTEGGKFHVITIPINPEWVDIKRLEKYWNDHGPVLLLSMSPIQIYNSPIKANLLLLFGGIILLFIIAGYQFIDKLKNTQAR